MRLKALGKCFLISSISVTAYCLIFTFDDTEREKTVAFIFRIKVLKLLEITCISNVLTAYSHAHVGVALEDFWLGASGRCPLTKVTPQRWGSNRSPLAYIINSWRSNTLGHCAILLSAGYWQLLTTKIIHSLILHGLE